MKLGDIKVLTNNIILLSSNNYYIKYNNGKHSGKVFIIKKEDTNSISSTCKSCYFNKNGLSCYHFYDEDICTIGTYRYYYDEITDEL